MQKYFQDLYLFCLKHGWFLFYQGSDCEAEMDPCLVKIKDKEERDVENVSTHTIFYEKYKNISLNDESKGIPFSKHFVYFTEVPYYLNKRQ